MMIGTEWVEWEWEWVEWEWEWEREGDLVIWAFDRYKDKTKY